MLQKGLVGLEAKTGKQLWRYEKPVSSRGANIPTPLARENMVYSAGAGTGGGVVRLKAGNGTVEAEQVFFSAKLPAGIGGSILVGDLLFGCGNTGVQCADFATGTVKWDERGMGPASLCFADGRIYLHGENGEVGLIEHGGEAYVEKGRFTPPDLPKRSSQMEKAWSYPVVANGRLYVRDLNMLWCWDIKDSAAAK